MDEIIKISEDEHCNIYNKEALDNGYIEMLKNKRFKWFITITYKEAQKRRLTDKYIRDDMNTLYRMIFRKCFGKHYKNHPDVDNMVINMEFSIERGAEDNPHVHILLSDISEGVNTKITEPFKLNEVLINLWRAKIAKEYVNYDCQDIYYTEGVISYILKESGTDYENLYLDYIK
ncbi:MAG: hypothetical protein ACQEWL_11470 [Pseudomonadota bacterium]